MTDRLSWDDIPSLEIEADTEKGGFIEQRSVVRLTPQDIHEVLQDKSGSFQVRVATLDGVLPGKAVLEDVNHRGMCFQMAGHDLKENESILLGGVIGERLFKCRAVVRWQSANRVGVEFLNASEEDKTFLKDLSSAKFFKELL